MSGDARFAICIMSGPDQLLTPRKIYQVLPDPGAEGSGYIRIIDDEGEDYLYPEENFVFLPVSKEIEAVLLEAA